ncbi:FtsH protease activity modulator HflK [Lysobacter sp. KIS68-7]|uniref:FtsH protease activity modulator HflK n=1 Tax=Lysobacter sp. KIS68-7 TaxID=2904252 RepID=UPI001E48F61F|nr:FtsH protease activity modulator HflK [Lysobacter sp. KIS68-7]UHQ18258.1 FtsH protease activity modulator HflK [Lysobacter sp. KIS68-7]
MAWNIPGGSSNKDGRNPWQRRGSGGFDRFLDPLRGVFGPGGGGGIARWIGVLAVLWLAFNTFVLVTEQQRGVVLRFGQFARVLQPGPHFKWPWPIERVTKVDATQIKTFGDTVSVLTRDENIVRVEINVQYRVRDPQGYLFKTRDADKVLQQAALSTVREQVGRSTLDTVLNARGTLSVSARQRLQQSLDAYRTGLVVTELNLPNARPPEEVKPAFDDVNSAQQDKDRLISEARAYAARVVPTARGQAAKIRTNAEGYKTASIARATGDAERFSLLVDQYHGAPDVTRKRLWLETLQEVLGNNSRRIVGGDSRQLLYVPLPGTTAPAQATPPVVPLDLASPTVETTGADRPARSADRPGREEPAR